MPKFKQFKDMGRKEFDDFVAYAKESQTYHGNEVFDELLGKLQKVQKVKLVDEDNNFSILLENIGSELWEIRKMLEIIADIMKKGE